MKPLYPKRKQQGFALLEALVAILLFSIGILALMGLQASAITSATESKHRADAAYLADMLIAQMRGDNTTDNGFASRWSSPNGSAYTEWSQRVNAMLPNAGQAGICKPSVTIGNDRNVEITVRWQLPQDQGKDCRELKVFGQIADN